MKRTLAGMVATLLMGIALIGCSQQNNPVETTQITPTPPPLAKAVTASKRIIAANGGMVKLEGNYSVGSRNVYYNLAIMFAPDALPEDTTISISIDTKTFAYNAQVAFAPHGLVFKKPGTLVIYANGVQLAQENTQLGLLYLKTAKNWISMPSSWGMYFTNYGGNVATGASIPHFSQYAFGRVTED